MVPETLEPSLQLASAVLSQLNMPPDDVQEAIQEFRRAHMGELQVGSTKTLCTISICCGCCAGSTWQSFCGVSVALPDPSPPLTQFYRSCMSKLLVGSGLLCVLYDTSPV